jgi:hypothetical protein
MKRLFLLVILLVINFIKVNAQGCSVCTQTASQLGEGGANGLNTGIIYLAMLPLAFIGILTYVWFKYNRQPKG